MLMLISISPYFLTFNGELSKKSSEWSNFGSFLSGINGVVFGFLSLLLLILTLLEMQHGNEKLLNQTKTEQTLRDIKWLTELLKNKLDNSTALEKNPTETFIFINHIIKRNLEKKRPNSEDDIIEQCIKYMNGVTNIFDDELIILGEILKRIESIPGEDEKNTAEVIFTSLVSNDIRFWLEIYSHSKKNTVRKIISRFTRFSHIPSILIDLLPDRPEMQHYQ